MIVVLRRDMVAHPEVARLCERFDTAPTSVDGQVLVITSGSIQALPPEFAALAERVFVTSSDVQLAHRSFCPKRTVAVGTLDFGTRVTHVIAGPCSVESEEQIDQVAAFMSGLGVRLLRGGAFKPRTSPYSFQGLGHEGLRLLRRACTRHQLALVTEVRDATHVDEVIDSADLVQVGAKSMYDHGILRAVGRSKKPALLKRGFGTTLKEFVQAAEFILCEGNTQVMLCERGIRTFEHQTRFTLDLCGVAYLKEHTNLPIIVDPSHAMGYSYGVADLARASVAMGIDGLMIEVHPRPSEAKSDAAQQLSFEQFGELYDSLRAVARAVGKELS